MRPLSREADRRGAPRNLGGMVYRDGPPRSVAAALLGRRRARPANGARKKAMTLTATTWVGLRAGPGLGTPLSIDRGWTDEFGPPGGTASNSSKRPARIYLGAIEGAGMLTKAQDGGQATRPTVILKHARLFHDCDPAAPSAHRRTDRGHGGERCGRPDVDAAVSMLGEDRPRRRSGAWSNVRASQGTS